MLTPDHREWSRRSG